MPTDRRQALLTLKYDMLYRGLESAKASERFAGTLPKPELAKTDSAPKETIVEVPK